MTRCWRDGNELLHSLPLDAEERNKLAADAEALVQKLRKRPSTHTEFEGRALLALAFDAAGKSEVVPDWTFLCSMAELAAAICDDIDGTGIWAAVSASARQLGTHSIPSHASAGMGFAPFVSGAATQSSSSAAHVGFEVLISVHDCSAGRLVIQAEEVNFMRQALDAARREVMMPAGELPDADGVEFDNATEAMRQQCDLGRRVSKDLGFTQMIW